MAADFRAEFSDGALLAGVLCGTVRAFSVQKDPEKEENTAENWEKITGKTGRFFLKRICEQNITKWKIVWFVLQKNERKMDKNADT